MGADGPVPAADLRRVFGAPTSEDNVRDHVNKLRSEIRAAVPDLNFDPIRAEGAGYKLVLR